MFYIKQLYNPNKPALIPDDYPWQVSDTHLDNSIEISPEDYQALVASFDLSAYEAKSQDERNFIQQKEQREYGVSILPNFIDLMGQRNLKLSQDGVPINVVTLASDNSGIKLLVETGALKTARGLCSSLKTEYPTHTDIYELLILQITNFLSLKGYE